MVLVREVDLNSEAERSMVSLMCVAHLNDRKGVIALSQIWGLNDLIDSLVTTISLCALRRWLCVEKTINNNNNGYF